MALSAALKAQIAAWYKALQQQIPDFIPRAPQRQMIADVAKTLAGEEGRHLAIEAPTGVGKTQVGNDFLQQRQILTEDLIL